MPGDDLRYLDWHVYGRLDALWVKLFEEESDRVVQILVDCSSSMEGEKLDYARALAQALAWIALGGTDRVAVAGLSDALTAYAPARRGRSAAPGVFKTIEEIHPGGGSAPEAALQRFPRQRGSGIALLISDLLYPQGPDQALKRLRARGNEVHVLHLLSPIDLRPALEGDVVLVDAETGEEMDLHIDETVLDQYQATVQAWTEDMAQTCRSLGVGYTGLLTSQPVEELLLTTLRRQGLLD